MNLKITKDEYRLLLDMLYLSDWIMNAHLVERDVQYPGHQALRKKICSHFKEMDAENIIEYSDEYDEYFELANYDDYLHKNFIEPYDEEVFWAALADRLAIRDLSNEIGVEQYQAMDNTDKADKLAEIAARYENEFAEHGLDNIKLDYNKMTKN